jgi:small subunit ribosomal protein S13
LIDASEPDKETPEVPDKEDKDEFEEEPQPEEKDQTEETSESEDIDEKNTEEIDTKNEVKESSEEKIKERPKEKAAPETPKKEKHGKDEDKKEKPKKRIDRGPDFKYIVRLSNKDVDGEKNVIYGLSNVRGIGVHMASFITDTTGVDRYKKMGDLTDDQVTKLQEAIDNISKNAPGWMLNHRKDYETGKNFHLISTDIDMRLRDEINIMKKIRSYRGIRHERGLPVRGQRTRANNRKGLALGVSKKREVAEPTTTK